MKMTLSNQMAAEIQHYRESRSTGKPAGRQERKAPDWGPASSPLRDADDPGGRGSGLDGDDDCSAMGK